MEIIEKTSSKKSIKVIFILAIFIAVFIFWLFSPIIIDNFFYNRRQRITFNDIFNGMNALFSGLAFAGIIVAIILQNEELKLQREELKSTRDELKGQKEQLEKHNALLDIQKFENTCFQMIKLYHEILQSIEMVAGGQIRRGTYVFNEASNEFDRLLKEQKANELLHKINKALIHLFENPKYNINYYYKTLYNIMYFIDIECPKNNKNKYFYINFIIEQLTGPELLLLFYYALSTHSNINFKSLIEKYGLLKDMPFVRLIDQAHKDLYAPSAFSQQ
ncbi:MAG: putative phage abortive infection protein [Deltaproteobacteria bacterium]|nr:putative phage abortive infection protein [Deltaproteobacteria bacterium]